MLDAIDRRLFTAWNGIHRVGLRADEEDENLFVYSLVSPALYMLFPAILAIPELIDLSGFTPKTLRRLAHDYRETVRRLLYVTGGERTPLIKNVLLPSRLPVAKLAFPNARYVHIIRDPREAIPSAVSLFYAMWQTHSPAIAADSPPTRALAEMFLKHYRLLCDEAQKQPPESWIQVRFEALVADPVGTVSGIYDALGLTVTPRFRERLAAGGRRRSALQESTQLRSGPFRPHGRRSAGRARTALGQRHRCEFGVDGAGARLADSRRRPRACVASLEP